MKQTAVEWLVKQLNQKIDFIPMDKWDEIKDIVQTALQMEREQIEEAYENGSDNENEYIFGKGLDTISAEQYYSKTFKK
jgi:hypothetical protein